MHLLFRWSAESRKTRHHCEVRVHAVYGQYRRSGLVAATCGSICIYIYVYQIYKPMSGYHMEGLAPPKLLAEAKGDENERTKAEGVGSNTSCA